MGIRERKGQEKKEKKKKEKKKEEGKEKEKKKKGKETSRKILIVSMNDGGVCMTPKGDKRRKILVGLQVVVDGYKVSNQGTWVTCKRQKSLMDRTIRCEQTLRGCSFDDAVQADLSKVLFETCCVDPQRLQATARGA